MKISYKDGKYRLDGSGTITYTKNEHCIDLDETFKDGPGMDIENFCIWRRHIDLSFIGRLRLAWSIFKNPLRHFPNLPR